VDITYSLELPGLTSSDGTPRFGRAVYDAHMYGDTFYRVSAVVTTLADAQATVDALRAAVSARFPSWVDVTRDVRLAADDWSGRPVRVILDYVSRGGV
jgi:hypothetical protein